MYIVYMQGDKVHSITVSAAALADPLTDIADKVTKIYDGVNNFIYWVNPVNWVKEGWQLLETSISTGAWDIPLLIITIVAVWLLMLGAKTPAKIVFWGWVAFWVLRGVIFV